MKTDKNKKMKAEKLQSKLDFYKAKKKKQAAFEKLKQEVNAISKDIEIEN